MEMPKYPELFKLGAGEGFYQSNDLLWSPSRNKRHKLSTYSKVNMYVYVFATAIAIANRHAL